MPRWVWWRLLWNFISCSITSDCVANHTFLSRSTNTARMTDRCGEWLKGVNKQAKMWNVECSMKKMMCRWSWTWSNWLINSMNQLWEMLRIQKFFNQVYDCLTRFNIAHLGSSSILGKYQKFWVQSRTLAAITGAISFWNRSNQFHAISHLNIWRHSGWFAQMRETRYFGCYMWHRKSEIGIKQNQNVWRCRVGGSIGVSEAQVARKLAWSYWVGTWSSSSPSLMSLKRVIAFNLRYRMLLISIWYIKRSLRLRMSTSFMAARNVSGNWDTLMYY